MATLFYTHPDFLQHHTGPSHPECSERLSSIYKALDNPEFDQLIRVSPPCNHQQYDQLRLIHPQSHIDTVLQAIPEHGLSYLDNETVLSSGSGQAALRAVGAVCDAVDKILEKKADNAFCAVRPPGHHAEPEKAMGFCLFNNIAIAAEYARCHYQLERIAIIDFDVHHGNGTQAAFYNQANVLYASTHEMPLYPGTGLATETGVGNIFNVPLTPGSNGKFVKQQMQKIIFPAVKKFKPELILVSAGFDAHQHDPLSTLMWVDEDYAWISQALLNLANECCTGRMIASLEGGYNLTALARSVALYIRTLITGITL
jgi:acetoin utilization deacetylase AcuC-like enzyme